jgi:hypothetical protein
MKKFSTVLLCGIAVMLLTIVLYFTVLGNIVLAAIHFISLMAILLAEAVTTTYAFFAKGSPRRIAAAGISGIMIPFAVVLSGVYIVNFPNGYGSYIGWYCVGSIAVNLLGFVLVRFDSNKCSENTVLQNAKSNMLYLRKLLKCILADPAAKPYEDKLRRLEEKLQFSNDCVIAAEDESIRLLLLQLQESIAGAESDCEHILQELEKSVDQRSIMTSRNV